MSIKICAICDKPIDPKNLAKCGSQTVHSDCLIS